MSNLAKDWQEGSYTVRVKDGEVEVSTIRTVTETYLTCATNVHKKYVATARCAPEDEFNLSMGVALAMDRLNKKLGKDKIEVGDKVKIKASNLSYITYVNWIAENVSDIKLAACYNYNIVPKIDGDEYIVKVIAPWKNSSNNILAYIQRYYKFSNDKVDDNQPCYLIRIDGLEKV